MASTAVNFNPNLTNKFKVVLGDSLKQAEDGSPNKTPASTYTSFRYNTAPPDATSKLTQNDEGQFSLAYGDDEDDVTYTGVQRSGRKLECLLVYNPENNTFTLERVSSVFTLNQTQPKSDKPTLPLYKATDPQDDTESEGEQEQLADAENPFDMRHFIKKGQSLDDDDSDREEKDEDTDMDMEPEAPIPETSFLGDPDIALTPGPPSAAATPIPRNSTPTPAPVATPSLPQAKRRAKKAVDPFMKPKGKPKQPPSRSPAINPPTSSMEESSRTLKDMSMSPRSALPSPMPIDFGRSNNQRIQRPSSTSDEESDEDSSDEDDPPTASVSYNGSRTTAAPVHKSLQPSIMSREASNTGSILSNRDPDVLEFPNPPGKDSKDDESDEDDEYDDLMKEFEEQFDNFADDGNDAEGDTLMIEGEERGIGLGISGGGGAAPVSLRGLTGGNRLDESESESSEEE